MGVYIAYALENSGAEIDLTYVGGIGGERETPAVRSWPGIAEALSMPLQQLLAE